jgi:diguanylate cyclase (GGDEF)-like protein
MSQGLLILGLSLALYYLYWQRVYLDELTGIPNRRALDEKLAHLDGAYSLAMVDIDHFKRFNDDYGHDQGDDVLRLVGGHFAEGSGGRAYRYGGEEFCVLFEGLDSEQAAQEADALRAALERRRFHIRLPKTLRKGDGPKQRGHSVATAQVKVTVSVGVAQKDKKHPEVNQVMKLADQGLYKAKAAGRNNVQAMN